MSKKEGKKMKRTFQTIIVAVFVVFITAGFAFAANATAGPGNFPFFHLGCLAIGGLTIVSLKYRYQGIYMTEAVSAFAMYTLLVALFTAPAIEAVKTLVS
jgi:hypothetical protein